MDDFHSFVGKITAQGGKDGPEDVMGGLKAALNLHWRDGCSRVSLIFSPVEPDVYNVIYAQERQVEHTTLQDRNRQHPR